MSACIEIKENWLSRESHGLGDCNCHDKVWLTQHWQETGNAVACHFCYVNCDGGQALTRCLSSWQVEWIQQQVVKKRTKRDYDLSRAQSTYFNDPKWPSMWYMVSSQGKAGYGHVVQFCGVWRPICNRVHFCWTLCLEFMMTLGLAHHWNYSAGKCHLTCHLTCIRKCLTHSRKPV